MTTHETATPRTPGQLYASAMDWTQRYAAGARADQLADPTPCAEWDVRQVLNHIIGENLWAAELFAGKTIAEVGDRLEIRGADAEKVQHHGIAAGEEVRRKDVEFLGGEGAADLL